MSGQESSRLGLELDLLQAMYPEQVEWDSKRRELKYSDKWAALQVRLPETYPDSGMPDIISARDAGKQDVRDQTKEAVQRQELEEGEERLDAIIACFQGVVAETSGEHDEALKTGACTAAQTRAGQASKTVIVWLHHLLALSKRKLALSAGQLSGITKPGYPGILIFSGPQSAVDEHIGRLKAENWQAFQVRYENEGLWGFEHGGGIREVESMAEVVKAVEVGTNSEQGARQRQEFLEAAGIK